jgi:hypothetical protein
MTLSLRIHIFAICKIVFKVYSGHNKFKAHVDETETVEL